MKALITGCDGFIGRNIGNRLSNMGCEVHGVDTALRNCDMLPVNYKSRIDAESFYEDIDSAITEDLDVIIHMGACSSTTEDNISVMMKHNLISSMLLSQYAEKHDIPFIYASSAAVYGSSSNFSEDNTHLRPLNIYGDSKLMFDQWMKLHPRLHGIGLRFFNVYGPGEDHKGDMASMITRGYRQIKEHGSIQLFKPTEIHMGRDFVYVQDIVNVVLHFIDWPLYKGVFNVGTGRAYSWPDIALAWGSIIGCPVNIQPVNFPNKLFGKYQHYTCADIKKLIGTQYDKPFRSLFDGMRDYYKCYLEE